MPEVAHPSQYIAISLAETLRSYAVAAEQQQSLTPEQLAIVYEQRWFNIWVPQLYGGLEYSFPEALHLEEALAWTDGSLGWTVTLCSGANWFVGFLSPEAAKEIYSNPQVCLAGSGKPSGIANITSYGYEVTGEWHYATGAPHATVFTTNCILALDGVPLKDEKGEPKIKAFWFHRDEVRLIHNWHTMGMIGTGSIGFTIDRLIVPARRSFTIEPGTATLAGPVYHFPFLAFAEATLAVNYSGMATRFLDLCAPLFQERTLKPASRYGVPPSLPEMLDKAQEELNNARAAFYTAIQIAWEAMVEEHRVHVPALHAISKTSRQLAALSRQLTDQLFPYCGLAAADTTTELNRVWRDLHTASQHALLTFPAE